MSQFTPPTGTHWHRHAIIYAVDVGSFRDSNGDGRGDLRGVSESMGYLSRLGVNCLWLLPFFATENRDNGYDITDYYAVDHRFGTMGDFMDLLAEAQLHGIRVLVDMVVNHTSDQHRWFQAARQRPPTAFRDYYIWNDEPPPLDKQRKSIFPDRVPSVWTWDERAGSFYYHQFYPFQPSLNHFNPRVRDEVRHIISFWSRLGVSGFRVDAAPHLINPPLEGGPDDPVDILREYRRHLLAANGNAVLIGEADLTPEKLKPLMGDDVLQLLFNFMLNGHFFLAMARGRASPMVDAIHALPHPADAVWANFLRNLDEVDLERLTPNERNDVMKAFAPDPRMRIFDRGIRRRLAPMLGNDQRRLRLAFAILMALHGPPVIVYGDEIGMGDDQDLPERDAVRTAMQWTAEQNGGFSRVDPEDLKVKVIGEGEFSYEKVNVRDQERRHDSLFNWLAGIIRVRQANVELVTGTPEVMALADDRVLCRLAEGEMGGGVLALHNLSDTPVTVRRSELGERFGGPLRDLLGAKESAQPLGEDDDIALEPYGYRWLRTVDGEARRP
jgi:maltose alpha-D-glucosyltransferase/alpha-amylase